MSVVDQVKNLFSSKQRDSAMDSRLSLSMPDDATHESDRETVQAPQGDAASAYSAAAVEDVVDKRGRGDKIALPMLGARTVAQHQRLLYATGAGGLAVLLVAVVLVLNHTSKVAQQLGATGQALMQSQRLAKSVSQALVGTQQAFPAVSESSDVLVKTARGLQTGDEKLKQLDDSYAPTFAKLMPLIERAEKSTTAIMAQQKVLTQVGSALRLINRQSSDLLDLSEGILANKMKQNASAAEIAAVGQLIMLTQRIGKSANEFLTAEGVSPEAVFLLGKDLNSFKEITDGLISGSTELRLSPARDEDTREQLEALSKLFDETRVQAGSILTNLQGLVSAREAQDVIISDSEALRLSLEEMQSELSGQAGVGVIAMVVLALAALVALGSAFGLASVQLQDSRKRREVAEEQRLDAERQEQEAKRVNDAKDRKSVV